MEEKKAIKISLSTFFLILAIIIICIISYFAFRMYNEKIKLNEELADLNNQNHKMIEEINEKAENTKNVIENENVSKVEENSNIKSYTYEGIKGLYEFKKEVPENDFYSNYNLYLYENGTFEYKYGLSTDNSIIGNYRIIDDNIVLNKIFIGGNDIGLRTASGELKLKINADGTLADTNNLLNENIKSAKLNIDLSNVILKKASNKEEKEYLENNPSINTHINISASENAISKGQ